MGFYKKTRFVVFLLFPALLLFFCPCLVMGASGGGSLVGFVYAADRTTPIPGAVLKLRNVESGKVVESGPADEDGILSMSDVTPGLYVAGITSEEKDFNFEHLIGIRSGVTGKVAFALVEKKAEDRKEEKAVQDEDDDDDKGGGILGFFTSPLGLALLGAATVGTAVAIVTAEETPPPASPFR